MAPVIAWTAVAGTMAVTPGILFPMVFIRTPPHFRSLAHYCKDDSIRAHLPMMPNGRGDASTQKQMFLHAWILYALILALAGYSPGAMYPIPVTILGGLFLKKILTAFRERSPKQYRRIFSFSIVHLFCPFRVYSVRRDHISGDSVALRLTNVPRSGNIHE